MNVMTNCRLSHLQERKFDTSKTVGTVTFYLRIYLYNYYTME